MRCPGCARDNPTAAQYCYMCGHALRRADTSAHGRNGAYAVQSAEGVGQLAILSTIMPHTSRRVADNYRWALILSASLTLLLVLVGSLSAAILAAAFVVPVTYLIYLYDVNLWEETPAPVIIALFLGTGVLATVVSLLFFHWLFDGEFTELLLSGTGDVTDVPVIPLLLFAVLLPIVAEIVKQLGPIWLARKPLFDDMIDAVTFGVAAGTAYAAFETVVAFGPVFGADTQQSGGLFSWLLVIANLMLVKSLIYGTATGLALAAFSGRGEGYDGLTPRYYTAFAIAAGANVLYWLGVRFFAYAPLGQGFALLWGLMIAAGLILFLRRYLQTALLEAALEDAANERRHRLATTGSGFCPECEMPLLPDALFCIACGGSLRATSHRARHHIADETPGSAPAGAGATPGGAL